MRMINDLMTVRVLVVLVVVFFGVLSTANAVWVGGNIDVHNNTQQVAHDFHIVGVIHSACEPKLVVQFGFGWQFWVVLVLTSLIQFAVGSVLEPKIVGESLQLHPITIILSLLFWALVWGTAGMFLAVPITVVVRIVLERIEGTKPVAELLAGRLPA